MDFIGAAGNGRALHSLRTNLIRFIPLFVIFAIISALAISARFVFTKHYLTGVPFLTLLTYQSIVSLVMLFISAHFKSVRLMPAADKTPLYISRILWGVVAVGCILGSILIMPVTLAGVMYASSPLFSIFLAPLLLNEKSSLHTALMACLGFAGVFVTVASYAGNLSPAMVLTGLATGISMAVMQIKTRKLSLQGEPAVRGVFWMHAAVTAIGLPLCVVLGMWQISWLQLGFCVISAGLLNVGQITSALALKQGKALPVQALSLLTLPLTIGLSFLFFHDHISFPVLVGAFAVLVSCWAISKSAATSTMS